MSDHDLLRHFLADGDSRLFDVDNEITRHGCYNGYSTSRHKSEIFKVFFYFRRSAYSLYYVFLAYFGK